MADAQVSDYVVAVEALGDPVTGLWCPDCMLPSGLALIVALRPVADPGAMSVIVWTSCTEEEERQ